MILIGVLGPTTSSVANLLTIGLVAVVDAVWVGDVPDLQTMIGVGMICVGFGILMWEGEE
jgi:drug/metabolite transporter (DMT)-like permease